MEQVASVGRIVHYVSYGTPGGEYKSRCVAAIITDIRTIDKHIDGRETITQVRLKIFNPDGDFNSPWLEMSEEHKGGTWHWPERV